MREGKPSRASPKEKRGRRRSGSHGEGGHRNACDREEAIIFWRRGIAEAVVGDCEGPRGGPGVTKTKRDRHRLGLSNSIRPVPRKVEQIDMATGTVGL